MSPRIPPQAPPAFKHTPQILLEETRAIIESSRRLEDGIARDVKPEEATFENVLGIMAKDEDVTALKSRIIGFYQYVSEDKALRDASSQAEKELEVGDSLSIQHFQLKACVLDGVLISVTGRG